MAQPIAEPTVDCPANEWCWARNRPLTLGGDRVLGTAQAIGPEGTFLRWAGDRWVSTPVPTRRALRSAWVLDPDVAWASDDQGVAWSYVRGSWTRAAAETPISRIFGGPNGTAHAIAGGTSGGHGGVSGARLLRYEGSSWVEAVSPPEYCLGGDYLVLPSGEIWSSGLTCDQNGAVNGLEVRAFVRGAWVVVGARITGQAWYPELEQLGDRVRVRATGLFEWDGSTWNSVERPLPPQQLPIDQSAFWDGLGYTVVPGSLGCGEGLRLGAGLAWCSGEAGIYVETTQGWASTIIDAYAETRSAAEWGTLPPELWAGGDTEHAWGLDAQRVYRSRRSTGRKLEVYDGTSWTIARDVEVIDLDGSADGWMLVLTRTGLLRINLRTPDAAFSEETIPDVFGDPGELRDLHVFLGGSAYVVGQNLLLNFDGTGWGLRYTAPASWELVSTAGTGGRDHWLLSHARGRSNEVKIAFSESGQTWSDIAVEGASGYGVLRTSMGETWLASDGMVAQLAPNPTVMPLPARIFDASVWTNGAGLWLSSPRQALKQTR